MKIFIRETAESDIIIKVTPKDKWVVGKGIETKIALDIEK